MWNRTYPDDGSKRFIQNADNSLPKYAGFTSQKAPCQNLCNCHTYTRSNCCFWTPVKLLVPVRRWNILRTYSDAMCGEVASVHRPCSGDSKTCNRSAAGCPCNIVTAQTWDLYLSLATVTRQRLGGMIAQIWHFCRYNICLFFPTLRFPRCLKDQSGR
jgi:hypothetical protein